MGFVSGIDAYRHPAVDPEEGTNNGSSGRKPSFRGSPHRSTVNSQQRGAWIRVHGPERECCRIQDEDQFPRVKSESTCATTIDTRASRWSVVNSRRGPLVVKLQLLLLLPLNPPPSRCIITYSFFYARTFYFTTRLTGASPCSSVVSLSKFSFSSRSWKICLLFKCII